MEIPNIKRLATCTISCSCYITNSMVKLRKKKILSPSQLADKLFQISADAEGISLEQYKKNKGIRDKQQKEYAKTHWVSWLTEAQRHLIATTTVEPHTYMGQPLSRENEHLVSNYKRYHPNYRSYLKNYKDKIPTIIPTDVKALSKEFAETPVEDIMIDVMFSKITANKAELSKQFGKPFDDAYDSYKKGKGKKSRDELANYLKNKKKETIEEAKKNKIMEITEARVTNKLQEAMDSINKVQQEYQDIGRKLRGKFFTPEKETLRKMNLALNPLKLGIGSLPNPFDFSEINKAISGTSGIGGLLDPEPLVDKSHGLNTLMKKHKMKSVFEIAPHFIETFETKKADYYPDSYDNSVALAKATGVGYQRLFEIICNELIKRKKHYKDEALLANKGIMIEELINIFESKIKSKTSIKYTQKAFFNSNERKEWSDKYSYGWKNYKRFNEQFPKWVRIFKARAFKKGTFKNVDELIEAQKKLRKMN